MQRWPHRAPPKRAPQEVGTLTIAASVLRAEAGERAELADVFEAAARLELARARALERPAPPPAAYRRHRRRRVARV